MGGKGGTLPPSPGRRCPEGAEVGSRRGMKRNARQSFHVSASRTAGSAVLPVIPLLTAFLDRERKRFLAFARNDDTGKAAFSYPPPSSGSRGPEGAEAHSRYRLKKNVRYAFPRFVIPSPAEGSFSFPVSLFLHNAVYMKHRDPTSHGVRCFPLSAVLASFPDRSRTKKISRFRSK